MKKLPALLFVLALYYSAYSQNVTSPEYGLFVAKGDSLYQAKNYKQSALAYSAAFKANKGFAAPSHRYNAACAWALAGYPDSAFNALYFIAQKVRYTSYDHTIADPDLVSLHNDKRWQPLVAILKANQDKAEAKYNKPLMHELDSICDSDQGGRQKIVALEKQYGNDSKQVGSLWKKVNFTDSINLVKVTRVLDKYGWVGPETVGNKANIALFLVIQHADSATRDKYLPMMRDAVKKGNAAPANLALMEDRSALEHGKKQIYGSQIGWNDKTNKYYISPIEDEANVDKRRASVGLGPLAEYVKQWGIVYTPPAK